MNRTGLFIALGLALVIGLLFGIYPELDLKLAALFYDPATRSFPLKQDAIAVFARDISMWIAWAFALPAIAAFGVKMVRPESCARPASASTPQLALVTSASSVARPRWRRDRRKRDIGPLSRHDGPSAGADSHVASSPFQLSAV